LNVWLKNTAKVQKWKKAVKSHISPTHARKRELTAEIPQMEKPPKVTFSEENYTPPFYRQKRERSRFWVDKAAMVGLKPFTLFFKSEDCCITSISRWLS
jgi:hypothetical protein